MRNLIIIAHDMRSTHNVGSLLRTAEGLGVSRMYLTGITPFPKLDNDPRLPHLADKLDTQITKTALGAEKTLDWRFTENIEDALQECESEGYVIVALEQSALSIPLHTYQAPEKIVIVLGTEVTGLPESLLAKIPMHLEIPMYGQKESFNVVQAAAMALYRLRFY